MPSAPSDSQIHTAVLVIGTGGSGLRAAIEAAEQGVDVVAVGKRSTADAHTTMAQGGINAALATMDAADSWQQHAADTLSEGAALAVPRMVQIMAQGAARAIADLEQFGVPFTREADGRITQRFFGRHVFRRTAFAGDSTGLAIERGLERRAAKLDIPVHANLHVTRLLIERGVVAGAYGFDIDDGTRVVIRAAAVVLASAGYTGIWAHSSARRGEAIGDSCRLAIDAGARLRDAEMVQFHPFGLLEPKLAAGSLVSEAARDEGAILRNRLGDRFMDRYDPVRREKSTRERVTAAMHTEIVDGRGTPNGGLWLDMSDLPPSTIQHRLGHLRERMLDLQMLDVTKSAVEVAPTANYSMGGVLVHPDDARTDVEGLFAVGEAASGLHGANRLDGNSLTELLVFGRIAGRAAATHAARAGYPVQREASIDEARNELEAVVAATGHEDVRTLQRALRSCVSSAAGVVRDEDGLRNGLDELTVIESRVADIGLHPDVASFRDVAQAFDLKSSVVAARAVLESSLERRETRGSHQRSDFPRLDDSLQVNLVWSGPGRLERHAVGPIAPGIRRRMVEVEAAGKHVE